MADITTIARPYAKALFEHALATKQIAAWSSILQNLAQAVLDPNASLLLSNPAASPDLKFRLLGALFEKPAFEKLRPTIEQFITVLIENKRLMVLLDIQVQFDALRSEHEKVLTVQVHSFSALTAAQEQQLIQSLSQRLQRKITLDISIDKSLLGGAVIVAGDLVIDGSVRGKLSKLGTMIAA